MALIANKTVEYTRDIERGEAGFTEGIGKVTVKSEYYTDPGRKEDILIHQEISVYNRRHRLLRKDIEEIVVEVAGGPRVESTITTWASVWLPGVNYIRALTKVQVDKSIFWPFTPWTSGETLGLSRQVDAYVIYTETVDDTPLTADQKADVEETGMDPEGDAGVVISSARLWTDALQDGAIVQDQNTNQTTKWVEGVVFEEDDVTEEADKYTIRRISKNALNPGDVQISPPRFYRKPDFRYRLPVPVSPPDVELTDSAFEADGVHVKISGGGATLQHVTIPHLIFMPPEKYRLMRLVVSEPTRSTTGDRTDWWDDDSKAPAAPSKVLASSGTTDLDGNPSTDLPTPTSYTEPGDVTPPDEAQWEQVAELPNQNPDEKVNGAAWAEYTDTDVTALGVYAYKAVAVIGFDESDYSAEAKITYNGTTPTRSHKIIVRRNDHDDSLEADVSPANDPAYPETSYGETVIFDIPALVGDGVAVVGNDEGLDADGNPVPTEAIQPAEIMTIQELADAVATRIFEGNRPEQIVITMDVNIPLFGLRKWMAVKTPVITFDTLGNGLIITSSTALMEWQLAGYEITIDANDDGVQFGKTRMRLIKR